MVRLCVEAGARSVVVTDVSINEPHRSFQRSGIGEAARQAGAGVVLPEERRFRRVDLHGDLLRVWPVLAPFLAADKIINLPVAKHHSLTGVTLGFKSWYGILGGQRQRLHQRIHESLADLGDFMRPTLTVIDGYRVLLRNGPGGGNLEDVALKKRSWRALTPWPWTPAPPRPGGTWASRICSTSNWRPAAAWATRDSKHSRRAW